MLLPPVFRSLVSRVMVNIDAVYFFVSEISRNAESSSVWMDFIVFIFKLSKTFFVVNHYSLISLKDRGKYFGPIMRALILLKEWKEERIERLRYAAPKPHRRKCPLSLPCPLEDPRTLSDPVRILLSPLIDMRDYWSSTAIRNVPHDWWIHNIQVYVGCLILLYPWE